VFLEMLQRNPYVLSLLSDKEYCQIMESSYGYKELSYPMCKSHISYCSMDYHGIIFCSGLDTRDPLV
jgi:hypothetical protein